MPRTAYDGKSIYLSAVYAKPLHSHGKGIFQDKSSKESDNTNQILIAKKKYDHIFNSCMILHR